MKIEDIKKKFEEYCNFDTFIDFEEFKDNFMISLDLFKDNHKSELKEAFIAGFADAEDHQGHTEDEEIEEFFNDWYNSKYKKVIEEEKITR